MSQLDARPSAPLFGDILRKYVRVSSKNIAEILEIDPAQVSRWLHNQRVPGLNSGYVEKISERFHLAQDARDELEQAQIRTLKHLQKPKRHQSGDALPKRTERGSVPGLLQTVVNTLVSEQIPSSRVLASPIFLQEGPETEGYRAVIQEALRWMDELPELQEGQQREVLFTYQGEEPDVFSKPDPYNMTVQRVLKKGYTVRHLCRLDDNVFRTLWLVEDMLGFLKAGDYQPSYFKARGILYPSYDVFIIPGTVARLAFASKQARWIDSMLLITDPQQIAILQGHFERLAEQTEPLLQRYSSETGQHQAFYQALQDAEHQGGGRLLFQNGLSPLTSPLSWYEDSSFLRRLYRARKMDDEWQAQHYRQRVQDFEKYLQFYHSQDICSQAGIHALVTGKGKEFLFGFTRSFSPPPDEMRKWLQNVIRLLEYPNYELALLDEEQERNFSADPEHLWWEVTGEHGVLLQSWWSEGTEKIIEVDYTIKEPSIIRAFREHFQRLWKKIGPVNKSEVRSFLEGEIKLLENH